MYSALLGLSALHPRDEIEVMLGVQAMSAYHAAAACWRIGMNHHLPNGDSTRHITTAASAARVFDSLLRAIERRQAKPLGIPIGRPAAQTWAAPSATRIIIASSSGSARQRTYRIPSWPTPPARRLSMSSIFAIGIIRRMVKPMLPWAARTWPQGNTNDS